MSWLMSFESKVMRENRDMLRAISGNMSKTGGNQSNIAAHGI